MSHRVHYVALDRNTLKALEQKIHVQTIVLEHKCKKCGTLEVIIVLSKKKAEILKRFTEVIQIDDITFISAQYSGVSGYQKIFNVGDFGLYGRLGRSIIKVKHK